MSRRGPYLAFVPRWFVAGSLLALTSLIALAEPVIATLRGRRSQLEGVATVVVRRTDVNGTILASGRVASSESTEIRCPLERLEVAGQASSSASGASTILSLIPDGSVVKAGDVLC